MSKLGVEIVDSIDELLKKVDVVMILSIDGRTHLEQVRPVFAAGKPVFVDKPIAGSLVDAIKIFQLAERTQCAMLFEFLAAVCQADCQYPARIRDWANWWAVISMLRVRWNRITPIFSGTAFTASSRCSPSWALAVNR